LSAFIYCAHLFILGAFIYYSVHLCNKYFAQLDKTTLLDFPPSTSTPLVNITHDHHQQGCGDANWDFLLLAAAVTFGSIGEVSAPISTSPAAIPAVKSESVKSFGSVIG
jgi:hypothetical protein